LSYPLHTLLDSGKTSTNQDKNSKEYNINKLKDLIKIKKDYIIKIYKDV